ncbi:hypothetical protein JCM10207_008870 [Rhodosporidiobolus poonsookiae]
MSTSSSPSIASEPSLDPSPSSSLNEPISTSTHAGDEGQPSSHKQDDELLRTAPFSRLPLEIVDSILVLSLPDEPDDSDSENTNDDDDERLEWTKTLSTVCKGFRAWAVPRMFPSSWTIDNGAEAVQRSKALREVPMVASRISKLGVSSRECDFGQVTLILEEVLSPLAHLQSVSVREFYFFNLDSVFASQCLKSIDLRASKINWWCVGRLPALRTLNIAAENGRWTSLDAMGISHLFQPSTLPSLRELALLFFRTPVGGRELHCFSIGGTMSKDCKKSCIELAKQLLPILPQLDVFEQNLLAPILVCPFPPETPILHTLFLGSGTSGYRDPIQKWPHRFATTDPERLDCLAQAFPFFSVRHLRIQLSLRMGQKPGLALAAEIDALLPHAIFSDLETLILPCTPLRDAEDWLKPRLDERRIRLEFEEMVNDDYWMEPSAVWRKICEAREEVRDDGK